MLRGWMIALVALGSLVGLAAAPSPLRSGQEGARRNVQEHDQTSFPLTGRHRTVACQECHINGQLEGTPTNCESCHWDRRQDDRYSLALGIVCGDCHDATGWKPVSPDRWNHETVTGFRLEGTHRLIECTDCHAAGFQGQSADCVSCHRKDFEGARDPNHVQAGFPTDCVTCHGDRATTWEGAEFDHSSFPLRGRHQTAACADCHTNGV
ncbi:MAG: cytochrome c3 family protein, partial [Acidobacteriota bacterium]